MPDLNASYSWAINTCNAPNVGYSGGDNRNQRTVGGITYYDCSSFIWYALKSGGFDVEGAYRVATGRNYSGNAITTIDERDWLVALGFTRVSLSGEWLAGDIMWRGSYNSQHRWEGHTEMVYEGGTARGRTMGAHSASRPLADQVSITTGYSTSSNWDEIYRYGSGGATSGISIFVIASICGNWWVESHVNPGYWESGIDAGWTSINHGYGLGQWTNTNTTTSIRLQNLYNYLVNNGYPTDSGLGEMNFFIDENVWLTGSSNPDAQQYSNLQDFLHSSSTNLQHLVTAFCYGWEGIAGDITTRTQYAERFLEYLQLHGNDTSITTWITGNRSLNWAESCNNAVMVYRFLSSGGGGGGTNVKSKMPLWMMCRPWWLL